MLRLKRDVRLVVDENGSFLLDMHRGTYWHLSSTGVDLLNGLADGRSLEDLVDQAVTEFDVDRETVGKDFVALLDDLRRAKLVEEQE